VSNIHFTRLMAAALGLVFAIATPLAATRIEQPLDSGSQVYVVFLQSRPVGREEVSVVRQADGWIIRGSGRISPPVDVVTRAAEIHYTPEWHPTRMSLDGTSRGQEVSIQTVFAQGTASSTIVVAGKTTSKSDAVAADTVVLPNMLLTSYSALARRLVGAKVGAALHGYIAPQIEVPITVRGVFQDRIETAARAINATRYGLTVMQPGSELQVTLWADADGVLLRLSVPGQGLELAREDIASASSRTTSFSLPTDEAVRIPANGFNLAGSLAKPATAKDKLPAVVLITGSGPTDRDSTLFGVPIMGHVAGALVEAGFLVVRYDKRGTGQSGGRAESATILDYVDDARAAVAWLEKRRDVDKRRIAVVGHSEGAWVALAAAARDRRIAAIALVAGPSSPGSEILLEQQVHLFERMKTPEAERQQRVALQKQIQAAVLGQGPWDGIPAELRKTADTPWFHSYLSFDPLKFMKDVRQPILIVQGELDTQVSPHHADALATAARARKRKVGVDVVKVPGVNHLLVPAATGEVDEYATLSEKTVSTAVTSAIAVWLAKTLGPASK
jgi:pimeloyl-ACP methyl ester carboxylesterase